MIIGLTGRKRSGKSTAARYLVENHEFTELSFAEPLKRMALAVDPRVGPESDPVRLSEAVGVWGWEEAKDRFPEVRRFLQRLGTEGVRDILGEDLWVEQVHNQLWDLDLNHTSIVIADVRFENEARLIRDWGGVVVEIQRRGDDPEERDPHASERGVTPDSVIFNPGDRWEPFGREIDRLVWGIKEREDRYRGLEGEK